MNGRRSSGDFLINLAWGVKLGLAFAAAYSLYVAVLFLAVGSQPFDKLHTSLLTVIATYVIGGLTSGTVVGVMRPYLHIRLVAILVGITAALFVIFGILVASQGMPWLWHRAEWGSLALCSLLLGSFGGNWFWNRPLGSS
jgi:hypothetical protein